MRILFLEMAYCCFNGLTIPFGLHTRCIGDACRDALSHQKFCTTDIPWKFLAVCLVHGALRGIKLYSDIQQLKTENSIGVMCTALENPLPLMWPQGINRTRDSLLHHAWKLPISLLPHMVNPYIPGQLKSYVSAKSLEWILYLPGFIKHLPITDSCTKTLSCGLIDSVTELATAATICIYNQRSSTDDREIPVNPCKSCIKKNKHYYPDHVIAVMWPVSDCYVASPKAFEQDRVTFGHTIQGWSSTLIGTGIGFLLVGPLCKLIADHGAEFIVRSPGILWAALASKKTI